HQRGAGARKRRGDPRTRRRARLHLRHGPPPPRLEHLRRPPPAALGGSRIAAETARAQARPAARVFQRGRERLRPRRAGEAGGLGRPRRSARARNPRLGRTCRRRARARAAVHRRRHPRRALGDLQPAPPGAGRAAGGGVRARAAPAGDRRRVRRGARLACLLALCAAAPAAAQDLLLRMEKSAPTLDPEVLELALEATDCAVAAGAAERPARLVVIDYTRPSTQRRLWLFDLRKGTVIKHDYVAHGRGSGGNVPTRFSNVEGSYQSSIGLLAGAETYQGENGYSLRLDGLEPGVNDRARERALVMHGADYVDPVQGQRQGRL